MRKQNLVLVVLVAMMFGLGSWEMRNSNHEAAVRRAILQDRIERELAERQRTERREKYPYITMFPLNFFRDAGMLSEEALQRENEKGKKFWEKEQQLYQESEFLRQRIEITKEDIDRQGLRLATVIHAQNELQKVADLECVLEKEQYELEQELSDMKKMRDEFERLKEENDEVIKNLRKQIEPAPPTRPDSLL